MTVRTSAWLKDYFQQRDRQEYFDDLIDTFAPAFWQNAKTKVYVDSTNASATDTNNDGTDPAVPMATLDAAFGVSGLTAGDIIYVMPGHNENIGNAQIDMDVAGVFVIGVGAGDSKPRFDFEHANASIDIGADNIHVYGLRFMPSVTVVAIGVDIEAGSAGVILERCEWMVGEAGDGTDEFVIGLDVKAGGHDLKVVGNEFHTHASCNGCTDAISVTGASSRVHILDNSFEGNWSTSAIGDVAAGTDILIGRNVIKVADGQPGIELHANTTGRIWENYIASTGIDADVAIDADDCEWFENYAVEADGETGTLIGVPSDSPTNFIGRNSANNDADTSTVAGNADGSILERLENMRAIQEICVLKADGAVTGAADDLFTITGGPILVTSFVGIVTTEIGAGASTCQIIEAVTAPAGNVNFSTAVDIDADAVGTSYTMSVATPGVFTPTTAGAFDQVPVISWLCPIGTINATTSAARAGVIAWYMTYKPLSPSSVVVAAA